MKTHWTGVVVARISGVSRKSRFTIGNAKAWLRLKTACSARLLPLLLLLGVPAAVQALDYTYTTNNGTITITKYIGSDAAVTIPSTIDGLPVTNIGDSAFFNCASLTYITIPNSVTSIGSHAFYSCFRLTSVTIPNSVASIGGYYAFAYCTNLTNVTIPNSVTSIGGWTFFGCSSLTSITIPNSVTNIGGAAFSRCSSLAAITVDALNSVYGSMAGVLFNKSLNTLIQYPPGKAGSYTIPNSVTSIGGIAFSNCTGLTSVTIPNSVTNIGVAAFSFCASLTNVTIPNSLASIEYLVFAWCTSLTGGYFKGNAPSVDSLAFYGDNDATVYYLPGATGWGPTFGGLPTALWKPEMQTGDASFGIQTNQFGFNIAWASGQIVVVDACTNLANPSWFPLQTNTLSDDSFHFSDREWTNHPARFYRLRSP
jgi:hypothetical protein